jgi:hypothetical protein
MRLPLPVCRRSAPLLCWLIGLLAAPLSATADDDAPRLMSEPIGFTQVADAFDERDPFDIEVFLGYRSSVLDATVRRERVDTVASAGRTSQNFTAVADYEHSQNELLLQLGVGIYRYLMVFVRLPIVLSDDRELTPADGRACNPMDPTSAAPGSSCAALLEPTADGDDELLFSLPLAAARRSGLPNIDFGVAFGVTNQYRTPHLPTWVLIAEGSIDTGQVMDACVEGCEPGISDGISKLRLESRWSYRTSYFEPFLGVAHDFPFINGANRLYEPIDDLPGAWDNEPPSTTDGVIGVAFIPWEDRGRFQRFELDLRGRAALVTSGRAVSPLFDALGADSNTNKQLAGPYYDRVSGGQEPRVVPFTGLTNIQSHAEIGLSLGLIMQAARYVRFALNLGVGYVTPHLITGAPACNPDVSPAFSDSDPRAGDCETGIINPLYVPAIDAPGQRFRVDDQVGWDFLASATGLF